MRWKRKGSRDEDFERELRTHLELEAEEQLERGLPLAEAQFAARRALGNTTLLMEEIRQMWSWTSLERLRQDVRYALRTFQRSPGFTAVAVLCLALGIGANTAIFSLINAVVLRMLPVAEPQRLVLVQTADQQGHPINFSYSQFVHMRSNTHSLAGLLAHSGIALNLSAGALTDTPAGRLVSDNYFTVLGVQPIFGRGFVAGDETVAVISYGFWQSRFQGDSQIVGRSIVLNGLPFTVIGIAPQGFFGVDIGNSADLYVPLVMCDRLQPGRPILSRTTAAWLVLMGRLQSGATIEGARSELEVLYHQAISESTAGLPTNHGLVQRFRNMHVALTQGDRGRSGLRDQFGKPLLILMTMVGLVLLIACANVASLLLARATARQKEIALRLALGAGRRRLLWQLLTESIVLSTAGALLGLLFAYWSTAALARLLSLTALDISADARVFSFTLAVSVLSALIFGAAPATQATRADLTLALKGGNSSGNLGRRFGLRNSLVVGQVALSVMLLMSAGLFIRTLTNLQNLDTGFRGDHVLLVSLNPGLNRYTPERTRAFYDQLLAHVEMLRGVRSVSLADQPLLAGSVTDGLSVEGRVARAGDDAAVNLKMVTPRFFETMGIAIHLGRDFLPQDRPGTTRVAIINETLARQYFSGKSPIGGRIGVGTNTADLEIVGVIADTKYNDLRAPVPPTVYLPIYQAQSPLHARTLHVRTSLDSAEMTAAIRNQVRELDKDLPIAKMNVFATLLDEHLVQERMIATLSGFFAALALMLASIGLYSVLAYSVQRQTREIGIRMSLGAPRGLIVRIVLRDCLVMLAAGTAIGFPISVWLLTLVRSQLFGVHPADPPTMVAAAILMVAVAVLAGYFPARRAARIDPMVALRYE